MTAGLGIDVMHMSYSAGSVDACDINPELISALGHNCAEAGIQNVRGLNVDSVEFIRGCAADSYDSIFIDPARRSSGGNRIYNLSDCAPDVTALLPEIMRVAPRLIIKASPMFDISRLTDELKCASRIIATGTTNECKEIMAVCGREIIEEPEISAFTVNYGLFSFTRSQERDATACYRKLKNGDYLLEPLPAIMKAAPFKLLCSRYNVYKVSANTHLYMSSERMDVFPGRNYRIIDIFDFDKKGIRSLTQTYSTLNIACRNFPLSPEKLAAKLKVKIGGDFKMFALTDMDGAKKMVVTRRE